MICLAKPSESIIVSDETENKSDNDSFDDNLTTQPSFEATSSEPYLFTQGDLNEVARDLNLSKSQAELLGSGLKVGISTITK